jgi:hypothetical protein
MKLIVILNGPPGSGKDTIADYIVEKLSYEKLDFKTALYKETARFFHLTPDVFMSLLARKETPSTLLTHPETEMPLSPRQALIHVSEVVIKPSRGSDWFGIQTANAALASESSCFICSDGGFVSEIEPLLKAGFRVAIIRVHRAGHSFATDSRRYIPDEAVFSWSEDGYDISMYDFNNEGSLQRIFDDAMRLVMSV